jgi:hypothetical protein
MKIVGKNIVKFDVKITLAKVTKDFWGKEKINKTMIMFVPACYL